MNLTMIDTTHERLLTIDEACFKVPNKNRSGRLDYRTVWAWMKKGVRGVKLERTRVGGRVFTSEEALTRFLRRLSGEHDERNEHGGSDVGPGNDGAAVAGGNCPPGSRPLPVTPAAERRRQEAVHRELTERFGLKP